MEEARPRSVDVLGVVWSKKFGILAFSAIVTIVSYVLTFFLHNQYEATSTIVISAPKFTTEKTSAFLSINEYIKLAMSSGTLQKVIDQIKPIYPQHKNILFPEILKGFIRIQSTSTAEKKRATLVTFTVRGTDQVFIKDVVNTLVSTLARKSEQIVGEDITINLRDTKEQYTINLDALLKAEKLLQENMSRNHLQSAEQNLAIMQSNLKNYEYSLLQVNLELLRNISKMNDASHPVILTQQALKESTEKLKKDIRMAEEEVYKKRLQETQLKRKIGNLNNSLQGISGRLHKLVVSSSEKTSAIKLLSKAAEPNIPIWPNRSNIVLIASSSSFFLGLIFACSKQHIENLNLN